MLAATVLYAEVVATDGLRQAIASAAPARRAVDVRVATSPAQVGALDAIVRSALAGALQSVGGPVARVLRADPFTAAGSDPATTTDLVAIGSFEGIDDHARLTAGRWARPGAMPIEATVSDGAAAALHVAVGDRVALVDTRDSARRPEVVVVGTWAAVDRGDAYWLGNRLEIEGSEPGTGFTTRGPFVVDAADLGPAVTRDVAADWRGLVPIERLTSDVTDELSGRIAGLRPRIATALPALAQPTVATDLPNLLDAASRAIGVSRSSILLLTLQFAVLAAYAVLLVAGMLVERRRAEAALVRSRGASGTQLVAVAATEALVLAVPAVVAAPPLALGIVRLVAAAGPVAGGAGGAGTVASGPIGASGPIDAALGLAAAGAAIAGLASVVVLALPTVAGAIGGGSIRASLARPVGRTFAQRAGLDVALVVVAAIALWQLQTYGAPLTRNARGALGADPLLVAAPAIALVAGSVVAIRLLPRIAEIGERVLVRARGLVAPLGARQLARRPLRYTRSTLLLVLAVALGTFAAAYGATWSRSQADQAAYTAAAPVRAIASDYPRLPAWATPSIVRGVPGIVDALPATQLSLAVGRTVRDGRVLAIDAARVVELAAPDPRSPAALASALHDLAVARPSPGIPLPGAPRRIRLTIDTAFAVATTPGPILEPADYATTDGVGLAVVVADATGRLSRIPVGSARLAGVDQEVATALEIDVDGTRATVTGPLRLEGVEMTLAPPDLHPTNGTATLRGVAVSDAADGEEWTAVPFDAARSGWSWTIVNGASGMNEYAEPKGPPGTIAIPEDPALAVTVGPGTDGPTYRLADGASADRPVPAIASRPFLDATGLDVGGRATVDVAGRPMDVTIAAATDAFAPLDPSTAFLVVDGTTLDVDRYLATDAPAPVTEWWLGAAPGAADSVATTLSGPPFGAKAVVVRSAVERSLATDPVSLGVIGALGLGTLAALAFAAIGFVVNATVATAERLGELGILRALGVSSSQLGVWLVAESAVLLVVGVVGGAALGLVLAVVVLPFASLTSTGASAVPSPVVVVPVEALAPIYASAAVLLVVAIVVASRQIPPVHVSGVLRGRDE